MVYTYTIYTNIYYQGPSALFPYLPMLNRPNVEFANFYIFCSSNGPTPICKISQKVNHKQKSYTRFSKTPSYPLTLRSV